MRDKEVIEARNNWKKNLSERLHGNKAKRLYGNQMAPEEALVTIVQHSQPYNAELLAGNIIGFIESGLYFRHSHITPDEREAVDEALAWYEDDLVAARDKVLEALGMRCQTMRERMKQ